MGLAIPEWFSYPEVVQVLREAYPPKMKQGFTVFFTGYYKSGASVVAHALRERLLQHGGRPVTLLEGDMIRAEISPELGYSKGERDLNIHRLAFIASEISKAGGAVLCAAIAPYDEARERARQMISKSGGFYLIHISTPLSDCMQRDKSGTYDRAKRGELKGFTGIDDPYETPSHPDLTLDASCVHTAQIVHEIMLLLERDGFIGV